jgi:hypothetical protein
MLAVLDHLEDQHGSVAEYLLSGGLTEEQLERLRDRLTA